MKFACDVMLGALAKWLRVSGHDVFYSSSIDRSGLFRVAREEGRLVLTRTAKYAELKEIPPYYIIDSDDIGDQIKKVYALFPQLDPWKGLFSRCVECNTLLKLIDKSDVAERLPLLVKERISSFYICPSCNRIFWSGTHVDRMKSFLKQILS